MTEDEVVGINSTCAVFAESEIVSLMAQGINKNSIIKGMNNAVARRIANLAGNGALDEDVYIDGGPAMNRGLIECLEDELFCDINVLEMPQFTVALEPCSQTSTKFFGYWRIKAFEPGFDLRGPVIFLNELTLRMRSSI